MSDAGAFEPLLHAAAAVTGQGADVVEDLTFSNRSAVARLRLSDGDLVVAKRPLSESAFAREREAFERLPGSVRPQLVGAGQGVILMEDLGSGPSVADILLSGNKEAAVAALTAWAETLGRALAPNLQHGADAHGVNLMDGLGELLALAEDLRVAAPPKVREDVTLIENTMSASSPWLAYCPGDTCPDNNRVLDDGSVRLFDFEGAGWRHAASEAAYCRAPFSTCWCVAHLPADVIASMEGAFMEALDPPQRDSFVATIGLAAVRWTVETFGHFRRFVIDGAPVGPRGRTPIDGRQYVVLRLGGIEAERERLPALAELANQLSETIRSRWPDAARQPRYPAWQ